MDDYLHKLAASKKVLYNIANGINPIDGTSIKNESFLNDPKVIRCFFFVVEYIESEFAKNSNTKKRKKNVFSITEAQKSQIILPTGNIGVNDFAKAINDVIDGNVSKKLTGNMINRQLKKMGILSEIKTEEGNRRTATNEKSDGYGILSQDRFFNNYHYKQVLFNDLGKKFILENIERIMSYESSNP